jgi:hypothetical protein
VPVERHVLLVPGNYLRTAVVDVHRDGWRDAINAQDAGRLCDNARQISVVTREVGDGRSVGIFFVALVLTQRQIWSLAARSLGLVMTSPQSRAPSCILMNTD